MKGGAWVIVTIVGALETGFCHPVFVQSSVGGPSRQTAVGGPAKQTSPVLPSNEGDPFPSLRLRSALRANVPGRQANDRAD
jgi:hypothetical protein